MKKQFGQHFLRQVPKELLFPLDALEKIQSLQKKCKLYFLEIGPGSGVVTSAVLKQLLPFKHLSITYEVVDIDLEAIQKTQETLFELKLPRRLRMVYTHKDILSHKIDAIEKYDFAYIFGSLPYNVSKKIVNATKQISLELGPNTLMLPSRFVIQREVADDYISKPPDAAFLGTDLSYFCEYRKIIKHLPPGAFYPAPKVESAIIEIGWRSWETKEVEKRKLVAKVIRQGFIAKRKVINSVFKSRLNKEKLTPTLIHILQMRAHELSLAEWELVSESLS
jgi:16S rRNA (adenine1518-N6/adenine1519-N6)-dimethyltransferase